MVSRVFIKKKSTSSTLQRQSLCKVPASLAVLVNSIEEETELYTLQRIPILAKKSGRHLHAPLPIKVAASHTSTWNGAP